VLIFKKGSPDNIKNYRPICLLSIVYKVFTRILLKRMRMRLNEECSVEQAGFRSGFSTIDHIHSLRQLIQKHNEFNLPLYLIFIDFEKAFDSVEHNAILHALKSQGIQHHLIEIIEEINKNTKTAIKLFSEDIEVRIGRGVRQGDVISPNLFTCVLEQVMRRVQFGEDDGVSVDGEKLRYLAFADDIVLTSRTAHMAENMLNNLNREAEKVGLRMHSGKTQIGGGRGHTTGWSKVE